MSHPLPAPLRRQAAEWLVRLDYLPDTDTQLAFAEWLALDPQHAEAIARLRGNLAPLEALEAKPAGAALRRATRTRREGRTLTSLAVVAMICASTLVGSFSLLPGLAAPDLSTASDERRNEHLADGSQIDLDASSAVDLKFDDQQRRVSLLRGQILVDVAKDPKRPFYVTTPQGSIRALGTRFLVERLEDATVVTMFESATQVDSAGHRQILSAGQRLRFDADGPSTVEQVDSLDLLNAWNAHQLLAYSQPLPHVLERLARHRKGLMLFDTKALSALRVTVMLPTDDSDQALRLLERTLPIHVRHYTPWLTLISVEPDIAEK